MEQGTFLKETPRATVIPKALGTTDSQSQHARTVLLCFREITSFLMLGNVDTLAWALQQGTFPVGPYQDG